VPPPDPAPIAQPGLRVLVVYETAELSKMPAGQRAVIYDRRVREYLNAKCPVGPDGKTREWRIWDKDVDTAGKSKLWQNAMRRPRKSTPWILISTKIEGYEGPLPATVDETLALIKRYGGE
jgi:hypothetical protein